ncbi:hypothetical protein Cgig2_003837 [Carnegiea gigantea]|uniref:Uncharacterized protein n=1 Tax=Carnegiea gigantea TaxID=171969 RepID=A0A9Q1Q6J8_9CARY|nr:hypothetical protein Cgig2_003837 [Carnegiea gigantea]
MRQTNKFTKFLAVQIGAKARTSPDFGDSSSSKGGDDGGQEQLAQMVIDKGAVVSLRSKAFKRMLKEDKRGKGIEKVRVLEDDKKLEANITNKAGMSEIQAVVNLRKFIQRHSPKVAFLLETKRSKVEMEVSMRPLIDYHGFYMDAHSRASRLGLLWEKKVDLTLLS